VKSTVALFFFPLSVGNRQREGKNSFCGSVETSPNLAADLQENQGVDESADERFFNSLLRRRSPEFFYM
jgi:hypothetical protein